MKKDKLIGSGLVGFGIIIIIISLISIFPIQYVTNNQYIYLNAFINDYPSCNYSDELDIYSPNYIIADYSFDILICNVNSSFNYGLDIVHINNLNEVVLASYFELALKFNQTQFEYYMKLSDHYISPKENDFIEFRLYNASNNELIDYSISNYLELKQ